MSRLTTTIEPVPEAAPICSHIGEAEVLLGGRESDVRSHFSLQVTAMVGTASSSGRRCGVNRPCRGLRPHYLVQLTYELAPLPWMTDCLVPVSVSTVAARDWLQPLQSGLTIS